MLTLGYCIRSRRTLFSRRRARRDNVNRLYCWPVGSGACRIQAPDLWLHGAGSWAVHRLQEDLNNNGTRRYEFRIGPTWSDQKLIKRRRRSSAAGLGWAGFNGPAQVVVLTPALDTLAPLALGL
jgi:hypothetical protein